MSIQNPVTRQKTLTEEEFNTIIATLDKSQRLDPPFPYVFIRPPFDDLGLGVDIPPLDE